MTIHDYLRNRRIESRFSIRKLSEQSGVSVSHISRVESGLRSVTPSILKKLCVPLEEDYLELLKLANLTEVKKPFIDLVELIPKENITANGKLLTPETKEKILELIKHLA